MLPYEWRPYIDETISMFQRAEFGTTIDDSKLDERQKLAIEAFQNAYNRKRNTRSQT